MSFCIVPRKIKTILILFQNFEMIMLLATILVTFAGLDFITVSGTIILVIKCHVSISFSYIRCWGYVSAELKFNFFSTVVFFYL